MGIAKVSNILRMAKDYKLSIEERMMFDWLVVKQEDFGLEKPFRHSIPQVQEATGIARHSQEKAIKHFTSLGFLVVGIDYYQNNPYRTYYVNFTILQQPEILSEIIYPETRTFKEFSGWIKELAIKQREEPTCNQKEYESTQAIEELYDQLCKTWNERIDMYNDGELTESLPKRVKNPIQLPLGRNGKKLLQILSTIYNSKTIIHAFEVYADKCLTEEITPTHILLYFLKYEGGEFEVVANMLNYFATHYAHSR